MKQTLLLLFSLLFVTSESNAQDGYFHLNGQRHRYRGNVVGHGMNRRILTNRQHYNAAKESGANLFALWRSENAIGYTISPASMQCRYTRHDWRMETKEYDTSYTIENTQRYSFRVMAGSGYPIMSLDRSSAVLITYAFGGGMSRFATPKVIVDGEEEEYQVNTIDIMGALTLDYKSGSEAMLDRGKGSCFTIGVGVEPRLTSAVLDLSDAQNTFQLLPHVKVEFGTVIARTAFKIRLAGNPGSAITYYKKEDLLLGSYPERWAFNLSGKGAYTVSLVWMPFSSKWHEKSWY